jgi:hypothetical protein
LLISLYAAAQDNAAMEQARKQALDQAQSALATAMQNSPIVGRLVGPENTMLSAPVTGAPYSADEVTTFTQTLADGTHIQREDKATVYRDSQGRLRRETPTEITITDPVAGVGYTLDPNKLTARKMTVMMSRVVARRPVTPSGSEPAVAYSLDYSLDRPMRQPVAPPDPEAATAAARRAEDLSAAKMAEDQAATGGKTFWITAGGGPNTFVFLSGQTDSKTSANIQFLPSQSIEGVLAEGTSANETIPAGAIGNDRPIQVVNERWYSSELKTMIMTKHSDPRTGEEVFRLTNIRRAEPSPDLFQVPAGYQIAGPGNVSTEAGPKR